MSIVILKSGFSLKGQSSFPARQTSQSRANLVESDKTFINLLRTMPFKTLILNATLVRQAEPCKPLKPVVVAL